MKYNADYFIRRGMSKKFAIYYSSCIEQELSHQGYNAEYAEWSLSKGFLFSTAKVLGINQTNYKNYLSDEDFYKSWPLNSWTRIWVDDKMTLKYILEGTKFSHLMPKYFFYTTNNCELRSLVDDQIGENDIQTLIKYIKDYKNIACKPNNASRSEGFCKLSYDGSSIYINKNKVNEDDIELFVNQHPNYIFTEYLVPEKKIAKIHKLIHTLRLVILNTNGNNPKIIGGYMRFGTDSHGEANYLNINDDCKAYFDFVSEVNVENGHIWNSKSVYFDKAISTLTHPDTGEIVDFYIPDWDKVKFEVLELSKYLFNLEYIGLDLCITDDGIKLMEINTLPGAKYMQIFKPIYDDIDVKNFFLEKILSPKW